MHFPKPQFRPLPWGYKLLCLALIIVFTVIGLVGLILPIIPGIIFLFLAAWLVTRMGATLHVRFMEALLLCGGVYANAFRFDGEKVHLVATTIDDPETRKLIAAALLCGLAILVAFTIQVVALANALLDRAPAAATRAQCARTSSERDTRGG